MKKLVFNIIIILMIVLSSNTFSQFGGNPDVVKIKSYSSFDKIYPGSEFKVALQIDVAETWHINS
ncbi:MAG: thiol:disulfide interchange protein, partial [Ignavibacterium sp.]